MRWLKAFGKRIASRDPDRQTAAVQIRVALHRQDRTRGMSRKRKGRVRPLPDFCNNPQVISPSPSQGKCCSRALRRTG